MHGLDDQTLRIVVQLVMTGKPIAYTTLSNMETMPKRTRLVAMISQDIIAEVPECSALERHWMHAFVEELAELS